MPSPNALGVVDCSRTGGKDRFVLQGILHSAPESQNQGCHLPARILHRSM